MKKVVLYMISIVLTSILSAKDYTCDGCCTTRIAKVKSPDGSAELSVYYSHEGIPVFDVTIDGVKVMEASGLGYSSPEGRVPDTGWQTGKASKAAVHSVWKPVWGKRKSVPDVYKSAAVRFEKDGRAVILEIRAYNDGVAYRFTNEKGKSVWTEKADFNFTGDYTAWYYNGERHNIGPEPVSEASGKRMPVMTVKVSDKLYLAVHEACLLSGKPMVFNSEAGSLKMEIVSNETAVDEGWSSAWRLVMFGRKPGDLVDSHIIELLNPDPEEGMDFSWVKPGVNLWDWRIDGAEWDGYTYGMNYDSWTRMVDFAAEQGFNALVLDANWYGPEFASDSDPVKGDKAKDVQNIIRYGKERGVGLWLYLNDVAGMNYPIEQTLAQYEEWGAAGVKYGFMSGKAADKNQRTQNITQLCARHHLCVDFHDYPVHPWGQARTWPNALTREYCQAQLDGHSIFYPKTFVTTVFVDMVAGPVDMNNGMFDLRQGTTTRRDNNQEVPSTICSEAARTLITYSGATIIPDIPEYYHKHPELLEYISAEKQPWMESKTLSGEIGEYIVMMRQNRDGQYLIGAATNEEARTIDLSLDFLPAGKYSLKITEDGPGADFMTNREVTASRILYAKGGKNADTLKLALAPGGGACVIIDRKE